VDAEQARVADRVARRATETGTIAAVDAASVELAQTKTANQLEVALLRIVVRLEPGAFAARHRAAWPSGECGSCRRRTESATSPVR
jgi:hypothetical protein